MTCFRRAERCGFIIRLFVLRQRLSLRASLLLVLLPFFSAVSAQPDWSEQRALFNEVEQFLKNNNRTPLIRHAKALASYPLYPYLQFYDFKQRIGLDKEDQIKSFLERHDHSPPEEWMRYEWLKYLADRNEWKRYAHYYRLAKTREDPRYACWYARALIRSASLAKAAPMVRALWLTANSQPSACDPVFLWGLKHKVIDGKLVWQRFLLAMERGPSRLTRYLRKRLPPALQDWAALASKAHQRELEVVQQIDVNYSSSDTAAELMQFAMQRLIQRSPQEAASVWKRIQNRCRPSCRRLAQIERRIGLALLRRLQADQAYHWLSGLPASERDEEVREWIVLSALRAGWWRKALAAIEAMDAQRSKQAQWQYWKAYSMNALGLSSSALAIRRQLVQQDNYYAYLAADRLNVPYALQSRPIVFSQKRIKELAALPAVQRIREFVSMNRLFDARREWHFVREELPADDLANLAVLFDRWGWSDGVIRAVADSGHQGDLILRFPLKYNDVVHREAKRYRLPAEWIYGVMRRESAFMEKIKSPAGALGLMQVMPKTANHLLRSLKLKPVSNWRLLTPAVNVRLGAAYLKEMHERYNHNLVFALAAYNAGPTRVAQWRALPAETEIWIDTIPFSETRAYIRQVLFYMVVYRYRLGLPVMRLSDLMRA